MTSRRVSGDVLVCDVLVIGGGFAGLFAAIRATEEGARVILVDKAYVSRSGASTLSSGVTCGPTEDDDIEPWVSELVLRGQYRVDERWTRQLLTDQVDRLNDLDRLSPDIFLRDDRGRRTYSTPRAAQAVRDVRYSAKRAVEVLRGRALEAGVQIVDRVSIVDLLTEDGNYPTSASVYGAVGFNTRSGRTMCFLASAVVLATGPLSIKGNGIDADTGDGLALAAKVGALILDAEFCMSGTFNQVWGKYRVISVFTVGLTHGARLVNKDGERFMARYDPERLEASDLPTVVAAFVREVVEGRGPVFLDLTECDPDFWPNLINARGRANAETLFSNGLPDPRIHPVQIEATRRFWGTGRGGPKIDLDGSTTVPGLYAAGALAKDSATGLYGSAGIPTAFAMVSGARAGAASAALARSRGSARGSRRDIDWRRLDDRVHLPLTTSTGPTTDEALEALLDIQGSVVENFQLDDGALRRRLELHESKRSMFEGLQARDVHDLVKVNEFKNIYEWSEICLRAMLLRTESRMGFVRLDYPQTDDIAWRCWHTAQRQADGSIEFGKLEFPYAVATYQPPAPRRYPDPLAAILSDMAAPNGSTR